MEFSGGAVLPKEFVVYGKETKYTIPMICVAHSYWFRFSGPPN